LTLSSSDAEVVAVVVAVGIAVVDTYIVDNELVKCTFRSTINDGKVIQNLIILASYSYIYS